MNKFIAKLEDLWVAVAFAESGVYEPEVMHDSQPLLQDFVRVHTA